MTSISSIENIQMTFTYQALNIVLKICLILIPNMKKINHTDIIKSSIIILIPEEDSRFTSNKYFRFLMNIIVSLSKDYVF